MSRAPASIIVVDDDDGHCELVSRNLRRGGIGNPLVALTDGAAALDYVFRRAAHADRPRDADVLMLLDINMPGISGIEVLRQIRADPNNRRLAVLMLTTAENSREVDQCHHYGCDRYVTKSVEPARLIEAVRCLLNGMDSGVAQERA